MGVSAEDALCIAGSAVSQRSGRHFAGQAQPHGVEPFQKTDDPLLAERNLLKRIMECRE